MPLKKDILIVGHVDHGRSALTEVIHRSLANIGAEQDIVFISPETASRIATQVNDEDIIIDVDNVAEADFKAFNSSYQRYNSFGCGPEPMYIKPNVTNYEYMYIAPTTRRERRAKERRDKKTK